MLKLLVKKQFLEMFRSFFYNQKTQRARSAAASVAFVIGYALLMVGGAADPRALHPHQPPAGGLSDGTDVRRRGHAPGDPRLLVHRAAERRGDRLPARDAAGGQSDRVSALVRAGLGGREDQQQAEEPQLPDRAGLAGRDRAVLRRLFQADGACAGAAAQRCRHRRAGQGRGLSALSVWRGRRRELASAARPAGRRRGAVRAGLAAALAHLPEAGHGLRRDGQGAL